MSERIQLRSVADGDRWKVTRDDKLVGRYPSQLAAQNAIGRLAKAESRKGNAVHAEFYRSDGTLKQERNYDRMQGARYTKGNQDGTAGIPRPS